MRSRVYASVGCPSVRPSVRLSLCPQTLQLRRGRQEISIDCCTAHSSAVGECGQWRVVSVHVKLNMHQLIGAAQVCGTGSVQRYGVRQSLCPIRPPHSAAAGLLLWAEQSLCNGTESVRLSVPFARRTRLLRVCWCGRNRVYVTVRSPSVCLSHSPATLGCCRFAGAGVAGTESM